MQSSLILTIIGEDRPGLVESVARVVTAHGGNWQESRIACLASRFAGIVQVGVPEGNAGALTEALRTLDIKGIELTVVIGDSEAALQGEQAVTVELMGQDHPGIVRDLSRALAARQINIDELETSCANAAWSGENMFNATVRLRVPRAVSIDDLRHVLEALAKDLMVDIELDANDKGGAR